MFTYMFACMGNLNQAFNHKSDLLCCHSRGTGSNIRQSNVITLAVTLPLLKGAKSELVAPLALLLFTACKQSVMSL